MKIKLGVIGTGMAWERLHWPALQELKDCYEITALCNRTRLDASQFAQKISLDEKHVYDDYTTMLQKEELDAVDVLVPINENYEAAAAVIKAGKHLIAEKPLAATMEGARDLIELSRKHNVMVMVAENYRYNEEINKIREVVTGGNIGNIIYFINNNVVDFESEMKKNTFAAKEWRQYPHYKGGTFLDAALHDIAAMRHIFGAVEQVYALGQPQQEAFSPYISIHTQILFKSGVIGQYNYYSDGKETQKPAVGFRIFGNLGEVYMENKTSGKIYVSYKDGHVEENTFTPGRGYYNELLNFYNAMDHKEAISVTPEIEIGDMKMVFDILTSVEQKRPVIVD